MGSGAERAAPAALRILYDRIDDRVRDITAADVDWPCRKGCDLCCRRLADVPRVSRPEWELLERGLAALPSPVRQEVGERILALAPERPVICPFLDREAGACLVYEYRPAACRTYGFYVERDRGLYCRIIEARNCSDVVWGNAESIHADLAPLGDNADIRTWFLKS